LRPNTEGTRTYSSERSAANQSANRPLHHTDKVQASHHIGQLQPQPPPPPQQQQQQQQQQQARLERQHYNQPTTLSLSPEQHVRSVPKLGLSPEKNPEETSNY